MEHGKRSYNIMDQIIRKYRNEFKRCQNTYQKSEVAEINDGNAPENLPYRPGQENAPGNPVESVENEPSVPMEEMNPPEYGDQPGQNPVDIEPPEEEQIQENGQPTERQMRDGYGEGSGTQPREFEQPEQPMPQTDIGYIKVQAFSGRRSEPIAGAQVTISRPTPDGDELISLTETGSDGSTPVIEVPTVSRELSQQPGNIKPYTSYNISVKKAGYFTVDNNNVQVYSGVTAIQPAIMIPIPENYTGSDTLTYYEQGPENLE